jgi:integrase/recombinase XerD
MLKALANPTAISNLVAPASTPEELLNQWDAWLELQVGADELAPTTRTSYRAGMRKFIAWLSSHPIASVGREDIQTFKAELIAGGSKPSAVNTWLAGVRSFYSWAVDTGRLQHNPTAGIKSAMRKGANKRHSRSALTNEEALRLLKVELPKRDKALIALMLYTGARSVELERANLEDVKTIEGKLVLMVRGKGRGVGDEEPLVVANAQTALMDWLSERGPDAGPLFTSASNSNLNGRLAMSTIRGIVKRAMRAAGIVRADVTTHSLRHTAITNYLKRSNGNIRGAQALGRHASVDTTLIYAHEIERIANAPEELIDYTEGK